MARPTKKGLEYFPLDCHMSDEVNLIIADFGIEGYGVLISMFQSIYGDKGYYTEWTTREQKLFSRKVGLDNEIVIKIINECIEWGIFNKPKYEELSILTSRRIQEHYATSTYKRTNVEMYEKYLIIDISDKKHINNLVTDDGNAPTTVVTDDESTQSKVKYSKSKDKVNNINTVVDFYKTLVLPKFNKLTDKRKKSINARLADYGLEDVKDTLLKASESNFLRDSLNSSWYNFDWLFNPNNFIKILEDKYNNGGGSNGPNQGHQNGPDYDAEPEGYEGLGC